MKKTKTAPVQDKKVGGEENQRRIIAFYEQFKGLRLTDYVTYTYCFEGLDPETSEVYYYTNTILLRGIY